MHGRLGRPRLRHGEKGPCLVDGLLEGDETAAFTDHVEEIAMFARGGVGPFAGRALW
jgi:hypothetical protein